jgi:virginiamycin B lyase
MKLRSLLAVLPLLFAIAATGAAAQSLDIREWPVPWAGSRPYAMAVDDQDRVWMVETGSRPNRFVGFEPRTEQFIGSTEIASGAGSVRHMYFRPATRGIWFGTDANTVGRVKVP